MQINMILDTRENELISKLSEMKVDFTVQQLDIGDILFKRGQEDIFVIERKTVRDLKASICDGRSREQKARLLSNFSKERILYLVEGTLNRKLTDKIDGIPVSTLLGSLINTQLRDNIKVYKTDSIEESANFLVKLLDKLSKDLDEYFNNSEYSISASEYASKLKKSKKANMTNQVWFISQLLMIPGVSENIADIITTKYRTPYDLFSGYEKISESLRPLLLAELTFKQPKSGKQRRIGKVISERVYNYIYGISTDINEENSEKE